MRWSKRSDRFTRSYRLTAKYKRHHLSIIYDHIQNCFYFIDEFENDVYDSLKKNLFYATEDECKKACLKHVEKNKRLYRKTKIITDYAVETKMTHGDAIFICKNIFLNGTRAEKLEAITKVFKDETTTMISKQDAWNVVKYLIKEINSASDS